MHILSICEKIAVYPRDENAKFAVAAKHSLVNIFLIVAVLEKKLPKWKFLLIN